jgi:glycerol-3-phosphate acyltransferase PlsY
VAALTFPLWVRLTTNAAPTFWASVGLALLIVLAHRVNIQRLFAGTENRFRTRKQVMG